MKARTASKPMNNAAAFHRQIVDRLTRDTKPAGVILRPWIQWLLWLALSLIVMAAFWMRNGIQDDVSKVLQQMPPLAFLLTAFAGVAFAAWEAISSSIPGRQTRRPYRIVALLLLATLFSIPFIFFAQT